MKEEIELARNLIEDLDGKINSEDEDNPLFGGAPESLGIIDAAISLLMSLKFSIQARTMMDDIEPWDPEGEFCELDDEELQEEEE